VIPLQIPTPEMVREYGSRFARDERAGPAERVLTRAFALHPTNADLEGVLTKVVLLNELYHTNVFAVVEMARHICAIAIDAPLALGSAAVVDRIAALTVSGANRRHYSFATKYCSWHYPEKYPIYDNLVERLLWQYQQDLGFARFKRGDLQEYSRYREIVVAFQHWCKLEDFTFRDVDKFLWLYAKELYGPIVGHAPVSSAPAR